MRDARATFASLICLLAVCSCGCGQPEPLDYLSLAQPRPAIEPTPTGDGHLGELASGAFVRLRFPVPADMPLAYGLNLANVVAFTGGGSSYRLIVRRDGEDGEVVYEGPLVAVGDDWNADNRLPIDITGALTEADLQRGYLDVYLTAIVDGDGWTLYRHNPGRREITALVAEGTPELLRAVGAMEAIRERQLAVIPMPREMEFSAGAMRLGARSRIVLGPLCDERDRFAADDLAEQIAERAGLRLTITRGEARAGDILLERVQTFAAEPEGAYHASVGETARVAASNAAGLFYGAQTIAQLAGPDGRLPHVEVGDRPAYPVRGLQYDVARGQTVAVEWWKRLIRELARCKLNMLVIYGEDDYAFEAFPFLGREGTFTPEKARELSEYAQRYHMQVVPQFESLGHASAILGHEELANLREAGQSWVYCTSNLETWEFLDTIYGELAEQFPNSQYIHVGGDEFETGFARCERCSARDRDALYAEHMNRLNELCRKHGRTMLFWPSHLKWTLGAEEMLEKDCIPTEWIYHGPSTYPTIKQYQDAGFADVWPSPAVVCFSVIWPDYGTTWRGIRGFLQAGAEEGCGGCMTTTWEWRHGGVVANSLPGMVYAAECAWSLGRAPVADYERRYAQHWLGLTSEDAGERLDEALIEPWPREGAAAICYDSRLITEVWWANPRTVLRDYAAKNPRPMEAAGAILEASDTAIARVDALEADATRNADLLEYATLAFTMYREAAHKLMALSRASEDYAAARVAFPTDRAAAAEHVASAASAMRELAEPLLEIHVGLRRAAGQLGAAMEDAERTLALHAEVVALADELQALAGELRAGTRDELPDGRQFGFLRGRIVRIGTWTPQQMSEEGAELRYDVTALLTRPGAFSIEWDYTDGAHALTISRTALLADGEAIASDEHSGNTGASDRGNVYHLRLDGLREGATYEIVASVTPRGGTDSLGDVWLISDDER